MVLALMVGSPSSFAGIPETDELRITVRVYDYVRSERALLGVAQNESSRILANAGIEIEWLACAAGQADGPGDAGCDRPIGPGDLIMRIVTESMAAKMPFRDITLGFAALPEEGGRGFLGGVFYHKVERMSHQTGTERYHILAHAIAHEIGHLLLRTLGHGGAGRMRAHWGPKALELARRGLLPFTSEEATRLRAEVKSRMEETTKTRVAVAAAK